jgi:hypothetical protein
MILGNNLDVNNNKILNVEDGTIDSDGVNLGQLNSMVSNSPTLKFNQEPPTDPDTYVLYTVEVSGINGVAIPETTVNMTGSIPEGSKAVYAWVEIQANGATTGYATGSFYPENFAYGGVATSCAF